MKINIDNNIEGDWAKVGTNIKDGNRVQIKNAGMTRESKWKNEDGSAKEDFVFKIMTRDKKEYNLTLNRTSRNNLAKGYGQESEGWVGKVATCFVVKQMVGDGLKNVLYLAPDGWTMNEDGEFVNPNEDEPEEPKAYPKEDTIDPNDIPF